MTLVGITSYGGINLATIKSILEDTFDNTGVFDFGKPMFVMDLLAYVLTNACKAGVMGLKSDNIRVYTEVTRSNMQRCITWTKKSQKGAKSLMTAQEHVGIPCKRLITPVKTSFFYLIHSFHSLIERNGSINYL